MPGDIYQKGMPGDPLNFPAALFNKLTGVAQGMDFRGRGGKVAFNKPLGGNTVKVQNTTGAAVRRFGILGLDEPIIEPTGTETPTEPAEFQRQVTFKGVEPESATHRGKFCILQEPLADEAIGLGTIAGPSIVRLTGAIQDFAEVTDGEAGFLTCDGAGSARVLWAEEGDEERWAIVRIADAAQTSFLVRLTDKDYAEAYIRYAWTKVVDDPDEDALTWVDQLIEGTFDDMPVYDANNVDHPVPVIVRVRRGAGPWYIIEEQPRNEVVRKTSTTPDASGQYTGFLQRWNQEDEVWEDTDAIVIRDANLDP